MAEEAQRKHVGDLTDGDETLDHGTVEHREGRKVWFERTIVTFPSTDDEVVVEAGEGEGDRGR